MLDLFGDAVTSPETIPARGVLNAAYGFVEFWQTWPSGPRKVAKQQALNKWAKLGCANNATHIRLHVEWLKTQDDWLRGFTPMPMTYLNQQRWLDWEPPVVKKAPDVLAELKAHRGSAMPADVRRKIQELRGRA